jgi:hypothetical protein
LLNILESGRRRERRERAEETMDIYLIHLDSSLFIERDRISSGKETLNYYSKKKLKKL